MTRTAFIASACLSLLWITVTASAAPSVVLPNITLAPNTANQVVPIQITGGNALQGMTLDFYVGSGGNTTSQPSITGVDVTGAGTIFNSNNSGQFTNASQKQWWEVDVLTNSGTVSANGTLANITVSTVGISGGLFALNLNGTNGNTVFDFSPAATATITPGSISVPEPASLSVGFFGAIAMLSLRFRKPSIV